MKNYRLSLYKEYKDLKKKSCNDLELLNEITEIVPKIKQENFIFREDFR